MPEINEYENRTNYTLNIGIDPGTTTGLAIYDNRNRGLAELHSGSILEMMAIVLQEIESVGIDGALLVIEDPRKRKWYGDGDSKAKMQGAGSVKRDCKVWIEFCEQHGIYYQLVHPVAGGTKLDKDYFRKMTGWKQQTNEHKRDAAMLVYR